MSKNAYLKWVVPSAMAVGIAICLYFGFLFDIKFIASILFLVVGCFFTWKIPKVGVRIIAFSLLLAVFEVLMFYNVSYSIGFSFGDSFALGFEWITGLLLGLHIYLNREYFEFKPTELMNFQRAEKRKNQFNSKVSAFKWRFRNKSEHELQDKTDNHELVVEARQAAKELLENLESEESST